MAEPLLGWENSHRKMSTWNSGLGLGVMHDVMGINGNESTLNFYQGSSGGVHIRPTDGAVYGGKVEIRGMGRGPAEQADFSYQQFRGSCQGGS